MKKKCSKRRLTNTLNRRNRSSIPHRSNWCEMTKFTNLRVLSFYLEKKTEVGKKKKKLSTYDNDNILYSRVY